MILQAVKTKTVQKDFLHQKLNKNIQQSSLTILIFPESFCILIKISLKFIFQISLQMSWSWVAGRISSQLLWQRPTKHARRLRLSLVTQSCT